MTDKKTTSDDLKKVFAANGLGAEKDWKRLTKKKNDAGQDVRMFENRQTGDKLEVVDLGGGKFMARKLTADASAAFEKPDPSDEAQNLAADQVMEKLLAFEYNIPATLIKQAGNALAGRFSFAVGGGDDGDPLYAYLAPKGESWDQHLEHVIAHLLPDNGGEAMEATFDFSNYDDAVKLVSDISKRGFFWDEELQADFDQDAGDNILQRVKAATKAPATQPPKL